MPSGTAGGSLHHEVAERLAEGTRLREALAVLQGAPRRQERREEEERKGRELLNASEYGLRLLARLAAYIGPSIGRRRRQTAMREER